MTFTMDDLLRALDRVPEFQHEDYTEEEIAEMLEYGDYYVPGCVISWGELGWEADKGRAKVTLDGVEFPIKVVKETGGMDEGSYASYVFEIAGRFFRKEGYYQSHQGYDWDGDFEEVEPFELRVTDYRPV